MPVPEGSLGFERETAEVLEQSVLTRVKAAEAYIAQTLGDMEERRPRKLWEVYCGHGRNSEIASSFGMDTQMFGFETGWNFSLKSHQRAFIDLMDGRRDARRSVHGSNMRTMVSDAKFTNLRMHPRS